MSVNVTTKSAQHVHARMIAIIVEKSTNDLSLDFFQQLYIYIYVIYVSESGQHAKPLSKPIVGYCQSDPKEQTLVKF